MVRAAFAWIACGDDESSGQALERGTHFIDGVNQTVEPNFKKVRRPSHPEGALKIGAGKNYADDGRFHSRRTVWRSSMRSTYFARRSNSRFTKSPGPAVARLVCAFVWGMSQPAK